MISAKEAKEIVKKRSLAEQEKIKELAKITLENISRKITETATEYGYVFLDFILDQEDHIDIIVSDVIIKTLKELGYGIEIQPRIKSEKTLVIRIFWDCEE